MLYINPGTKSGRNKSSTDSRTGKHRNLQGPSLDTMKVSVGREQEAAMFPMNDRWDFMGTVAETPAKSNTVIIN